MLYEIEKTTSYKPTHHGSGPTFLSVLDVGQKYEPRSLTPTQLDPEMLDEMLDLIISAHVLIGQSRLHAAEHLAKRDLPTILAHLLTCLLLRAPKKWEVNIFLF